MYRVRYVLMDGIMHWMPKTAEFRLSLAHLGAS
jgi:hypothetical protein